MPKYACNSEALQATATAEPGRAIWLRDGHDEYLAATQSRGVAASRLRMRVRDACAGRLASRNEDGRCERHALKL